MDKTKPSDDSPHSNEIYDAESYLKGRGKVVPLGPNWGKNSPNANKTVPKPVDSQHGLPTKRTWYGAPTGEKYEDRLDEQPKFKHGGTVAHEKHVNSIGEHFKTKLATKQEMLASLKKAYAKTPNAKLKKRVESEEKLIEQIKNHLHSFPSHGTV
jgi:hypothetical protein